MYQWKMTHNSKEVDMDAVPDRCADATKYDEDNESWLGVQMLGEIVRKSIQPPLKRSGRSEPGWKSAGGVPFIIGPAAAFLSEDPDAVERKKICCAGTSTPGYRKLLAVTVMALF